MCYDEAKSITIKKVMNNEKRKNSTSSCSESSSSEGSAAWTGKGNKKKYKCYFFSHPLGRDYSDTHTKESAWQ